MCGCIAQPEYFKEMIFPTIGYIAHVPDSTLGSQSMGSELNMLFLNISPRYSDTSIKYIINVGFMTDIINTDYHMVRAPDLIYNYPNSLFSR